MTDKNEFYREFTTRIFNTPSIEAALTAVGNYLKRIMPLEVAFFVRHDEVRGSLRILARVAVGTTTVANKVIAVPEELWQRLQTDEREAPYIADVDDELARRLMQVRTPNLSHLIVPLRREKKTIGFFSVVALGSGRYDQTHQELFCAIANPASIALANAIAHENLIRYRDTLIDENRFLSKELLDPSKVEIVGADGGMKHVLELVNQVAPLNNTVLLLGETGSGKEVIANAIHFASPRKDGPFIKVNCGAIPDNLIDTELFGHEKGAFTGAVSEKRGRFERANGGTIFLDEIGELPQPAQVRLLRVIQHREIERVGGTNPIPVDIRIIAATHRNLETMVSENKFREDLWFRLNVFPLIIPPLRQRREDIPALTYYFLRRKSMELGLGSPPTIAPGAMSRLADYGWPGNVRELENLIERELIRYRGGRISFDTLEPKRSPNPVTAEKKSKELPSMNLDEVIHNHIAMVLELTGGKIHGPNGAAEILGLKTSTLRARMDKLGMRYGRSKE